MRIVGRGCRETLADMAAKLSLRLDDFFLLIIINLDAFPFELFVIAVNDRLGLILGCNLLVSEVFFMLNAF